MGVKESLQTQCKVFCRGENMSSITSSECQNEPEIPWQAGLGCIATCAFLVIGVGIFSAVYSVVVGFDPSACSPPPPMYADGTMSFVRSDLVYNHTVTYTCNAGFSMHGPRVRICSKEGLWMP